MRKARHSMDIDQAKLIAAQALGYLAQNSDQLGRFMELTGLSLETLREDAGSHHVLGAVLDHMMRDESLMLAFAASAAIEPELVASASAQLIGTEGGQGTG